jgi:toxin ParE1/3/4
MRVIYHPDAEAEVIEAAEFYESRVVGLGGEFLEAIDAAVDRTCADPFRYPILEDAIRRCRVKRFPYCIYYRVLEDAIWVLVVKHHSRDPEYWKRRESSPEQPE